MVMGLGQSCICICITDWGAKQIKTYCIKKIRIWKNDKPQSNQA